jgi:hypothetical protein
MECHVINVAGREETITILEKDELDRLSKEFMVTGRGETNISDIKGRRYYCGRVAE